MMTLPRYANLALKRCSDNRDMAFAMSAATVGKLAAHPPVPRSKAMIPYGGIKNEVHDRFYRMDAGEGFFRP